MLYVIGTSEFDFVAIKSNTLASVDYNGNMHIEPFIIGVECDIPNSRATFFNNLSDAVGVLENLKKKGSAVKFESFIGEPVPTIKDLHIYQLSASVVNL